MVHEKAAKSTLGTSEHHQLPCSRPSTTNTSNPMASTESAGVQQQKTAKEIQDAKAMPPPPVPVKGVLLEPELNALQDSLKVRVSPPPF